MSNGLEQYFSEAERALMDRRTTGDFTPRESLLLIELQTRYHLYANMADGAERAALLAECETAKQEMLAADFVNGTMNALNAIGQRAMDLHKRAVEAAKAHPA